MIKQKNIKNKNFKKGFTLVELLIVIAIIGIMTAVLLVSMSKGGVNNTLKVAGRQLSGALRESQNYALTGKQKEEGSYPCAFKFSVEPLADGVYYNIKYASRSINEQCGQDEGGYIFEDFVGPVKFVGVESVSVKEIIFTVPHATYTPIDQDAEEQTEFIIEKKGKKYKVVIYASGRIEELGFVDEIE